MSITLLVGSDRLRSALAWSAHRSGWWLAPLAALGIRAALGWHMPTWAGPAALATSVLLLAANWAGGRLHDELDDAGLPCRWCDVDGEVPA
jgi:hypothetical protein